MGAVVGVKLAQNVRHVPFNRILADGQLSSDLFVGVSAADETEDLQFAFAQPLLSSMFGQLTRYLGGNSLLPRVDRADRLKQFRVDLSFQQIPARSRVQCTENLYISRVSRQHNDSRVGKLAADCDNGFPPVHGV